MNKQTYTFWIMISIVAISGLSQGMLLPAIAIIFEQAGVSSGFNGLHATALYLGILLISPFLEEPMRRFGMKPMVVLGGFLVVTSLFLFTQTFSFWLWFALRLAVGVGDHMLHVGAQTWITTTSDPGRVGRNVSIYGAFFGIGFAVGPYLASTVQYGMATPFMISTLLCFVGWLLVLPTQNARPEQSEGAKDETSLIRYKKTFRLAWVALLAPFVYGLLEAMLSSNLPVYAMRNGLSVQQISMLLPVFAIGGLITQVPLGMMSDQYGRGRVLIAGFLISSLLFFVAALFDANYWLLLVILLLAGMFVGSAFSLGLGYTADLLPKYLLPAGNILCGIAYSIGSIIGPIFGGLFIQYVKGVSFFMTITLLLGLISAVYVMQMRKQKQHVIREHM